MKTIHRYELPKGEFPTVTMPENAVVLSAEFWKEAISVWALVEDLDPITEEKEFAVLDTGGWTPFEFKGRFIATIVDQKTGMVKHVFELYGPKWLTKYGDNGGEKCP